MNGNSNFQAPFLSYWANCVHTAPAPSPDLRWDESVLKDVISSPGNKSKRIGLYINCLKVFIFSKTKHMHLIS